MLSPEQLALIESNAQLIVNQAPPGCGKTHTAREIAIRESNAGAYVTVTAFNLEICRALCSMFGIDPKTMGANNGIEVLNFDKITYRATGRDGKSIGGKYYALGSQKRDTGYLAKHLGIDAIPVGEGTISANSLAGYVEDCLVNWCKSGDDAIRYWHSPSIVDHDDNVDKSLRSTVADFANVLKLEIERADGKRIKFPLVKMNVKFAWIMRKWAEAGYPIAGNVVIIDEAQDLPKTFVKAIPVWLSQGKRVILCGDKYQELYAWAGACNAMQAAEQMGAETHTLRDSYRFGPTIATIASSIIAPLAGPDSVIGKASDVADDDRPADMYLYATNALVIGKCMELAGNCQIPDSLATEILTYVADIVALNSGKRATGPLSMHNAGSFAKAVRDDPRMADLKKIVQVMEEFGATALLETVERSVKSATGPIVSTIHRIKGMEADTVEVTLPTPKPDSEGNVPAPTDIERMVAYVAVTRARKILRLNNGDRYMS